MFVLVILFILLATSKAMIRCPPNPSSHIGPARNMLTAESKYVLSAQQITRLLVHIRDDHWFAEFNPAFNNLGVSKFGPLWSKLFNNLDVIISVFFMLLGPVCVEAWSLRSYYPGLLNWFPYTGAGKKKGHATPGTSTFTDLLIYMKNFGGEKYSCLPSADEWNVFSKLKKIEKDGRDFYILQPAGKLLVFFNHCREYVLVKLIYPMPNRSGQLGWYGE